MMYIDISSVAVLSLAQSLYSSVATLSSCNDCSDGRRSNCVIGVSVHSLYIVSTLPMHMPVLCSSAPQLTGPPVF